MIRIPLHAARLALPALLASCGWAQAQSALLPPPPASVCAAPTVPTTPGDVHMFPGRWWNPQRNGIGWDFFYNDGQSEMYLTWFVYDANGRPVWLHGEAKPLVFNAVTGERTWQSRLFAARWNRNGLRQLAEVGQVSATFPNQTTTRAAVSWRWNTAQPGGQNLLPVGAGTYDECLLDTYRDPLSPLAKSVTQLNQAYSSNWFYYATAEHPLGGWGVDLLIDIVPEDGHYWETATAAIFDDANRPTWLQSKDDWGTSPPPGSTFGTTDKGRLRYYRHRFPVGPGQPVHPAILNCAIGEKDAPDKCIYAAYEGQTADGGPTNFFRREIDNARRGNMQLKADVPIEVTQLGNAPDAAAIKWPPADNATPFPATIPVMHYDSNHVIVDKSICRVPNAGTSCTFTVSWVADDPSAQIRRLDLNNNGAASAPLASGVSGTLDEPLNVGDRFQYQLTYSAPGVGIVTLRSPEVRVLLDGHIADQNVEPADCASGPGCDLGTHDASAGAIPATADVSGGAASYSIPIGVAPGRAGMQPELALTYGSRGGNGIAGMGWGLSGLSSVSRCPRTVAQDGAGNAAPVTLGQNDALCLDGQRLIRIGGSAYGLAGAVYRTELDNFARITQSGGDLAGNAACFRVEDKAGRILHYGAVANGGCSAMFGTSRVQPSGVTATAAWLVKKTEDRVGNNIVYTYGLYGAGELLIEQIHYTGLNGTVGSRYVSFNYEDRPDNDRGSSYQAGGLTESTRRLKQILTGDGATPAMTYDLDYTDRVSFGQTSLHSGRSQLQSITQCSTRDFASTEECLKPTIVLWNDAPPDHAFHAIDFGSTLPPAVNPPNNTRTPREIVPIGDLDGDGTRELVVTQYQADNQSHAWLVKYTADREYQQAIEMNVLGGDPAISENTPQADIDGDGRADLVNLGTSGSLKFSVWNEARGASLAGKTLGTLFRSITTNIPWQAADQVVASEDLDGDGHVDIIALKLGGNCLGAAANPAPDSARTLCLFTNLTRRALAPNETSYAFSSGIAIRTMAYGVESFARASDVNGDGISDISFNELYTVGGGTRLTRERLSGLLLSRPANTAGAAGCGASGSPLYQACTTGQLNLRTTANAPNAGTFDDDGAVPFWTDVNGDGLTDVLFATAYSCVAQNVAASMWCIQLATGKGFTDPIRVDGGHEALTLRPNASNVLAYSSRLVLHDANSDGRAEVLYPSALASRICQRLQANFIALNGECQIPQGTSCNVTPISPQVENGGRCSAKIMMCGDDPSGLFPLPADAGPEDSAVCGQYSFDASKLRGIDGTADFSAYVMKGLRFEQSGANAFRAVAVDLGASGSSGATHKIVSQSGRSPAFSADLFGDGLADLVTTLGCGNRLDSSTPCMAFTAAGEGPATLPDGTPVSSLMPNAADPNPGRKLFISENVGAAQMPGGAPILPELVRGISNGMGDTSFWNYVPLSSKGGRAAGTLPVYEIVPGEATYADANHFYFQSTMPVVSTFTSSPGTGLVGFRSWRYGYREAMYNHTGRGFQGFRAITKEQIALSGDLQRAIRSTTTFHQKFPLTSRVEKVESGKPRGARDISPHMRETYEWRCNVTDRNAPCDIANGGAPVNFPYALSQVTTTFDPSAAEGDREVPVAQTEMRHYDASTAGAGWDAYGNSTFVETDRKDLYTDGAGLGRFVNLSRTREARTYDYSGVGAWWVDRLATLRKTTFPVEYGDSHRLPADASTPSQMVETKYDFYPDRTPKWTKTQEGAGDDQYSRTDFFYPTPNYGQPSEIRHTAKPTDAQPASERISRTTYDTDGYFPTSVTHVTDPASGAALTTFTTHRRRDGQVAQTIEPTGITRQQTYDAFGRLIRVDTLNPDGSRNQQPVQIAWQPCSGGACGNLVGNGGKRSDGSPAEQYASYVVTTVQNGSPTKIVWHDVLGREIKSAARGFDGTFAAKLTEYDAMGMIARQSAPFYLVDANASAPSNTAFTYDRAGRVTRKMMETRPGVPAPDPAGGNPVTDYSYAGNRTDILVRGATIAACSLPNLGSENRCMRMQRYAGVLGMMRTVDAQGGVTRYWSDAANHPVAIADVNANAAAGNGVVSTRRATVATYNELGYRTSSFDPNQGMWTFAYNPYGEPKRQTDARGAITTVVQRDAVGRVLAQTQVMPRGANGQPKPGSVVIASRDEWSYRNDGLLEQVRRCEASDSVTPPAACPIGTSAWGETYGYDDAGRVEITDTTQATLGLQRKDERTTYYYDANFARHKAVKYPSGLIVQNVYTRFGALRDVLDAETGARFWGIGAMDAWGNVTRQDYGNGMRGEYAWSPVTGHSLQRRWRSAASNQTAIVDQLDYVYDSLGNLKSQTRTTPEAANPVVTEVYAYDSLQRLVTATPSTPGVPQTQYGYDPAGNVMYKSDFSVVRNGAYRYPTAFPSASGCGPNATDRVTLPPLPGQAAERQLDYTCDANGNVIASTSGEWTDRTIAYDAANRPRRTQMLASAADAEAYFRYAPDGRRTYELLTEMYVPVGGGVQRPRSQMVLYGPRGYVYEQLSDAALPGGWSDATMRHELGDAAVVLQAVDNPNGSGRGLIYTVEYKATDRLGSPIGLMDATGSFLRAGPGNTSVSTRRSFDAFGKTRESDFRARNGTAANPMPGQLGLLPATRDGFTGHEHLDSLGLIHMNGRVYDYQLGRFVSVDPLVQFPANSQSLNPYSYVLNNPLSGVDPTGYATASDCDASEQASACLQEGANLVTDKDGNQVLVIVAKAGDNVSIEGSVHTSQLISVATTVNVAINPKNGAEDWVANGPSGRKDPASILGTGYRSTGCAGAGPLACYFGGVHMSEGSKDYGVISSLERTFEAKGSYGGINGVLNNLGRAAFLIAEHLLVRYDYAGDFLLAHNPTEGALRDFWETMRDKVGWTTPAARQFSQILGSVKHSMSWVAHSQGGVIFTEGMRVAANAGVTDMSNIRVVFEGGANNKWVTSLIAARAGLGSAAYADAPNDYVPQVIGLRGLARPWNLLRGFLSFPLLFTRDSPHTFAYPEVTD